MNIVVPGIRDPAAGEGYTYGWSCPVCGEEFFDDWDHIDPDSVIHNRHDCLVAGDVVMLIVVGHNTLLGSLPLDKLRILAVAQSEGLRTHGFLMDGYEIKDVCYTLSTESGHTPMVWLRQHKDGVTVPQSIPIDDLLGICLEGKKDA